MRTIAVISPGPREGRTTLAVNLAGQLAASGTDVALLSPSWNDIVVPGVTTAPHDLPISRRRDSDAPAWHLKLAAVADTRDVVLVDLPAWQSDAGSTALAARCDRVLLTAMSGRTSRATLNAVLRDLRDRGADVWRLVTNAHCDAAVDQGSSTTATDRIPGSPASADTAAADTGPSVARAIRA